MVKTYLRGRLALTASLEDVSVWNIKQSAIVHVLKGDKAEVTCLRASPDGAHVAVGYDDGRIRVWHIQNKTVVLNLHGHRSAVTCIRYNRSGSQLVSGSKDTDLIVWDAVGEVGLFRLRGHKDMITDIVLLESAAKGHNHIVSSSKDTFIKIWSLVTQHCVQTLVGHTQAVWALDADSNETRIVSGSSEQDLRVWKLVGNANAAAAAAAAAATADGDAGMAEAKSVKREAATAAAAAAAGGKKRKATGDATNDGDDSSDTKVKREAATATVPSSSSAAAADAAALMLAAAGSSDDIAVLFGVLPRKSTQRVQTIRFNTRNSLIACQATDKSIELWKVRSAEEVSKKLKRREKRQREKKSKETAAATAAAAATSIPTKKEKRNSKTAAAAAAADAKTDAKADADADAADGADGADGDGDATTAVVSDEFESILPLRTTKKIRSFCFSPAPPPLTAATAAGSSAIDDRMLVSLTDNSLAIYDLKITAAHSDSVYSVSSSVELAGHRSGIRSVSLSADDSLLLTTSSENIKVWNVSSKQCIRTLESGYGLCGVFVPGDRHVIVGTKTGHIEVWELGSATCVQKIEAHSDSIWSMDVRPDGRGLITGSADKEVKGWDFELVTIVPAGGATAASAVDSKQPQPKQLQLVHTRTLKLTDQVLCVRHSPNGKYVAVGLLDCTIKVFYEDSLKFFLSMYGHKLPVLSIDISSDSTLLISASADKNVKVWGLDFGDLHKSFFAHQDSVMKVQFVPQTHYFFSVGKDKLLKYWDADKFELVLTLSAHHSEVWGLTVSSIGDFVITGGNDRSLRVWTQTDEPVFLDSEREKERNEAYEKHVSTEQQKVGTIVGGVEADSSESASVSKGKATSDMLRDSERLIELLDIAVVDDTNWTRYYDMLSKQKQAKAALAPAAPLVGAVQRTVPLSADRAATAAAAAAAAAGGVAAGEPVPTPPRNPMLWGKTADESLLSKLVDIKSTDLEETLLVLPFEYAMRLLSHLDVFIAKGKDTELCVRAVLFLLQIHHTQIIANQMFVDALSNIRANTQKRLAQAKDEIGFNLAAIKFLKRELETSTSAYFFGPADTATAATGTRSNKKPRVGGGPLKSKK